jgi:hypothetical protein
MKRPTWLLAAIVNIAALLLILVSNDSLGELIFAMTWVSVASHQIARLMAQ